MPGATDFSHHTDYFPFERYWSFLANTAVADFKFNDKFSRICVATEGAQVSSSITEKQPWHWIIEIHPCCKMSIF